MLIQILLLFIGLYAISKKEIKISKKRTLSGKKAHVLGLIFIITVFVGLSADLLEPRVPEMFTSILSIIYVIGLVVSVFSALYFVVFEKNDIKNLK